MSDRVAAINCTSCGGALQLNGGHRVRAVNCSYCGAVMDAHADYQVLAQYKDLKRPQTPLRIGMTLTLKGVEHTLIGIVESQMREEGQTYRWVDHQLFSPTHGYSWLTFEDGHFVWSYRVREVPQPARADRLGPKTTIRAMGMSFQVYETCTARISYVEGELTWVARLGDQTESTEAIAPPYLFAYERSANELEYAFGEYLTATQVSEAAGDTVISPWRSGIHPAQPEPPRPLIRAMGRAGRIFAPIALVGLLATLAVGGTEIQRMRIDDPRTGAVVPFNAPDAGYLYQVSLEASVNNTWAYYEVGLNRDGEEVELGSLGRDIEYYTGTDSDGSWSEGSQAATATFHVPEAGEYELEVLLVEAESEAANHPVTVVVAENVFVSRYFLALFVLMLIAAAVDPVLSFLYEKQRWKPVMGDDDD
ncbi:MAG: DUF4178 domain-containing protein [Alphaproteobacteria bacterium]